MDDDDEDCSRCKHSADAHNDAGAYSFGRLVNAGLHMCYATKDNPDGTPGNQFNKDGTQNWCGCRWKPSRETRYW